MEELHPFSTIMITFLIEPEASTSGLDMSGEGLQALQMIQKAPIERFGGKVINASRPGCQIVIFANTFDAIDCSKEIEDQNSEQNNLLVIYLTLGELDGSGTYLKDPGITDRVITQISRPGIFVSKDILNTIQNNRSRLSSSNGMASEPPEAQTINQSKNNNSFINAGADSFSKSVACRI